LIAAVSALFDLKAAESKRDANYDTAELGRLIGAAALPQGFRPCVADKPQLSK
jgi:hypothetical protein